MDDNKAFIKSLLTDTELEDNDCDFLMEYLQSWLVDSSIDVNQDTVKMLNKHKDNIDKLKKLYSKNKIMDLIERKITLSQIANGELTIEKYKTTKDGIIPYDEVPSFNERINAIQVLNALDSLDNGSFEDRTIIIDDIN